MLAKSGIKPVGTFMILTVKGDIHDIGKDLVRTMLEGASFNVIDLGVNVSPEKMIEEVRHTSLIFWASGIPHHHNAHVQDEYPRTQRGWAARFGQGYGGRCTDYGRVCAAGGGGWFCRGGKHCNPYCLDFLKKPESSEYLLQNQAEVSTKSYTKVDSSNYVMPRPVRRLATLPAQSSLQRVLTTLKHQEPDRVPHFEWVHDLDVIKAMTKGGDYHDLVEQYDIDGVMVAPAYRKRTLGEPDLLVDEWGAVRRIGKDNYAMPVDEEAPIKTIKDLETWNPPDPDDDYRYEPINRVVERFGGKRAIILQIRDVWSGPRDYMGYAQLFINLMEAPDLVEGVVQRCVDH